MHSIIPRYSKEEFAQRGDQIYKTQILPHLNKKDDGKYVLIDIETEDYEIDNDELLASDRLILRHPDAQVWMLRVGINAARRFSPRRQKDLS